MFRRRPSKPQASRVAAEKNTVLPNELVGLLGDVLFFLCVVFGSAKELPGVVLCIIFLIFVFCVFVVLFLENNETFAVLICKMVDLPSLQSIIQRVDWVFPVENKLGSL